MKKISCHKQRGVNTMVLKILIPFLCFSTGFAVPSYANPDSAVIPDALKVITSEKPPDPPKLAAIAPAMVTPWEQKIPDKSYLVPALEVTGFLGLLNVYDRIAYPNQVEDGKKVYSSTLSSTWDHLKKQNWVFDKDPFSTNQFAHPYQGAAMYGLARSTGLGFWESLAYSNLGSFAWKMAGETDPPSINDQITTGTSGSLLGEAMFRMAELVLKGEGSKPDLWHEVGAAIISPPTAFNRTAFGDRYKSKFPSLNPANSWRLQLGSATDNNTKFDAVMDFNMSYGLPGKPGYTYTRPLDYFDFEISGRSRTENHVNNLLLRGLLYGKDYHVGNNYRGIWGVYGSFDYLSPSAFRVSTTALSLGTTGQAWIAPGVALQGSLLGGVGFGAAGTTPVEFGERDYHFGVVPQGLLALRLLFGNRAALEVVGRGYYVSGTGHYTSVGSTAYDSAGGSETIVRVKTAFNVRVYGRHGLGLQFVESIRNSQYGSEPSRHQTDGTTSLVYTFTGDSFFGAVEWRDNLNR
jgi:hypothetical protein